MFKTVLSLLGVVLSAHTFAQHQGHTHTIDAQNTREGENVEYCLAHKMKAQLLQNPAAAQSLANDELIRAQEAQNQNPGDQAKAITYYIPVVFHLLHNNGVENISDDQILDALDILNRDYDLQNADAASVVYAFNSSNPAATSVPTDADIQFRLATKAPNGACFSGITHTVSSMSYVTSSQQGGQQVSAIMNGNDVYQGEWPGDEYLNIFICGDIGGAAGYTFTPSNWIGSGMTNGIWILHNYVGSIGTSSSYTSRSLTHEVGHWLNLDHPWGDTNNPGLASNCNTDDAVDDTPDCIGLTSCNLTSNSCNGDNSYWGFDQIDNTENYMDYSYCSKMFTPGQVQRMRNALNSGVGGRNNLKTAQNLIDTGADGNLYLCEAEFTADKTTICAGETIQFEDMSFNAVSGWTWTFTGGSPASATSQDPQVTYNTPGLYAVTLQATDGSTNDTETKTAFIRVLPAAETVPFLEGFEGFSSLNNIEEWEVYNPGGNAAFAITSATGHGGSAKSAKLSNFGQAAGNEDELISSTVDLSGITSQTNMTLSFRYAYRKRASGNDEWLKVFVTNDCGDSWAQRKTLHGDQLSDQISTSAWTPGGSDWVTVHMTNVTANYWVDNFRYKFEFESDGGNNFYLDNINIYPGSPSDDIVLGIAEAGQIEELSVYPNPADEQLNVRFTVGNGQAMDFFIQDVTGKVVQSNRINAATGTNLVSLETAGLSSGMYFLQINAGGAQKSIQFIVK